MDVSHKEAEERKVESWNKYLRSILVPEFFLKDLAFHGQHLGPLGERENEADSMLTLNFCFV